MNNFSTDNIVSAKKLHRCTECYGAIQSGEKFEQIVVYEEDSDSHNTCLGCKSARDWLINETDWPNDVDIGDDGEGRSYFYTMLRDHLMEQTRDGDVKYVFRAYRHVVAMDKRRTAYPLSVKGNSVESKGVQS